MLDQFEGLTPTTRPRVTEALESWKKALDDIFVDFGRIEAALYDAAKIEALIVDLFHLPVEADKYVSHVTFQPKSTKFRGFKMNFDVTEVTLDMIDKLRSVAETLTLLCTASNVVQESGVIEEQPLYWEVTKNKLGVSADRKTAIRMNNDGYNNCQAVASEGWKTGIHSWKVRLNGTGGHTSAQKIHWIVFGVAMESFKNDPVDGHHVEGQTFGHCTWNGLEYFSLGKVSGCAANVAPNAVVTLTLDCDQGTLSYAHQGCEYLRVNVPKNTMLYPWAHLYAVGNSVEFVD